MFCKKQEIILFSLPVCDRRASLLWPMDRILFCCSQWTQLGKHFLKELHGQNHIRLLFSSSVTIVYNPSSFDIYLVIIIPSKAFRLASTWPPLLLCHFLMKFSANALSIHRGLPWQVHWRTLTIFSNMIVAWELIFWSHLKLNKC